MEQEKAKVELELKKKIKEAQQKIDEEVRFWVFIVFGICCVVTKYVELGSYLILVYDFNPFSSVLLLMPVMMMLLLFLFLSFF